VTKIAASQNRKKMNGEEIIKLIIAGAPIRVEYEKEDKKKLIPEEQELAMSLVSIAKKYGKFNQDGTGIWAGYYPAEKNKKAEIGVKCSNCVLYEGGSSCKIIALPVEPEGKCRFAVIPDGVVKLK
jgi:hypothetical protein